MGQACYALLVAINTYPPSTPPLRGCRNDMAIAAAYLRQRCAAQGDDLHLIELADEAASRAAVIGAFHDHFGQAGPGDLALFAFWGHGSQVAAPPELWAIEPDRLLETLVCYDSRTPGGSDLVDKELALLIAQVAARGPEVVVLLDCCHAGTATRDTTAPTRGLPPDERPRPWSSFLNAQAGAAVTRGVALQSLLPAGRHVLLAACEDHEVAHERRHAGEYRGAFSAFLFASLEGAAGPLSYRELLALCAARMRTAGLSQTPQLEAIDEANIDRPFLGGAGRAPASFVVSYDQAMGWSLNAGSIHGIVASDEGQATLLLFPYGANGHAPTRPIAQARVLEALPQRSKVALIGPDMPRGAIFTAVPALPAHHRLRVRVAGAASDAEQARAALTASPADVELVTDGQADVHLRAEAGAYSLSGQHGQPIARYDGAPAARLAAVVERLAQIAHWRRLYLLDNPTPGRLAADDVRIELAHGGEQIWPRATGPARLRYTLQGGTWRLPIVQVQLSNQGQVALYCALLALGDDHNVTSLLAAGCQRLEPGARIELRIGATVADELWSAGITETTSYLKLVACTAPFDAALLEHAPTVRSAHLGGPSAELNARLRPTEARGLLLLPAAEAPTDDWFAAAVAITVVRPPTNSEGDDP